MLAKKFGQILKVGLMKNKKYNYKPKEFWETRARDLPLTLEYLKTRVSKEFGKQKWITFCETLIGEGFSLSLYEAKKTYSKYITVRDNLQPLKPFRVRFSNHKPTFKKENQKDCDFYVGVGNNGTYTTEDALKAVRKFFEFKGGKIEYVNRNVL